MQEPLDEQILFGRLKNNIELYASSATQILRDLEAARSGRPSVLYNWDYSLAAGMLWSARRAKSDELQRPKDLDFVGAAIFALYPKYIKTCGFTLAISPPTVLELLRALLHKADEYADGASNAEVVTEMKQALRQASDTNQMYQGDGKRAATFLNRFSEVFKPSGAKTNFSKLAGQLQDDRITSLTKVYGADGLRQAARESRNERGEVLAELLKIRQRNSQERETDFHFRNFIDAANISSTIGLDRMHKERDVYFLGPTPRALASLKGIAIAESTRQPFTAFLRLVSLSQASEDGHIRQEAQSMVEKILQRAHIFSDDMRRASFITDMTSADRRELRSFLREYMDPIFKDAAAISEQVGGPIAFFENNPMLFRDRFKEVEEEMLSAAKQVIASDLFIKSSEVLECFDLRDDPVVRGIFKRLGID